MLTLLVTAALAAVPPPDYDDALAKVEWYALNQRIEQACPRSQSQAAVLCDGNRELERVVQRAHAWETTVMEDAGLAYLSGLASRYLGDPSTARQQWERATRLDPAYRAPWYDVGELYLASGELERARSAFTKVLDLTDDPTQIWIAHWRLAEVAGMASQTGPFETHLREALRNGFDPRMVGGLPNWGRFYADARLRPTMESLFTVYGGRDVLQTLNKP